MRKRTVIASAIFTAIISSPMTFSDEMIDDTTNTNFEIIVISDSKTKKPLKDVAESISVITKEDLDK